MHMYRQQLPQLESGLFITDGGLETTLVFHEGLELPEFAAFDLLKNDTGTELLRDYFRSYLDIAAASGHGFILESATWRASPDWARAIGYSDDELDAMNHKAIEMLHDLKRDADLSAAVVVSGCVGPRDDGYHPASVMTAAEAQQYHDRQIGVFDAAGVDMVSAITMTNIPEAVGIVRAAAERRIPVAISFTVETDGRLPTGESLQEAVTEVDRQSASAAAYFMVNCAHPSHFDTVLESAGPWAERIQGIRANASKCSHAELDEATELDAGDPQELAANYQQLLGSLPNLRVLGGCCGTDLRHLRAIAEHCPPVALRQSGLREAAGGAMR